MLVQYILNACARFFFDIPLRSHVTPYLNKHSILKMAHYSKLLLASLHFGTIKYKTPVYLYNKVTWFSSQKKLAPERVRCNLLWNFIRQMISGKVFDASSWCWNNISPPIRNLNSIARFKNKLKSFLIKHLYFQRDVKHDTRGSYLHFLSSSLFYLL